jgi:predicted DNA-binding protein YlxM (UPF0122 family)
MLKLYQNKKWLGDKYIKDELSISRISELYKIDRSSLYRELVKLDIPCRSYNEANHLRRKNHCNLSQEAIEWLNGELLGDGCLDSRSIYSARFMYGSKYLEYVEYVKDTLNSFGIKQVGKINKRINTRQGNISYFYASRCYVELLNIYERFYPEGIKIVPKDIELTPLTCRQWYIGDGCLIHNKIGDSKNGRAHITLYTCGFTISDVEWLLEQLNKLSFKVTRQVSKNSINISAYSTERFLNYIGSSPVKCYDYKWSYFELEDKF